MISFNEKLDRYAELAVKIGVNIQPNQFLYISTSTDNVELVRLITKKLMKLALNKYLLISQMIKLTVYVMS